MAQIAVAPLVMKDCLLRIDVDNYEKHVSGVTWEPSASSIEWHGLTPDSGFTDVSSATWTAELAYVQDWTTVDSLSRYLYEHEGETVGCEFTPTNGDGPSFTANLVITPGAIGGEVNSYATTSVTLGSDRPVLVEGV